MKIISLIFTIVFLISCNESKENNATNGTVKTEVSSEKSTTISEEKNTLKQQGDYTALFNREARDCSFINEDLLAKALNTKKEMIATETIDCAYLLTDQNGIITRFYFKVETWKNKTILKEIKTAKKNREMFGKDSKLSQYQISETGDTYLSMHQNRMVRIINETSETAIIIMYDVETDPSDTGYDKKNLLKDIAREQAYSIANFLLKEYQK